MQKEGHKGLTGLERGKPCKNFGGKRQKNLLVNLVQFKERKVWKTFWKVSLNKSNSVFKKPESRFSIDQKSVSIDRNRQRLP